jgi:hypothetical protein
MFRAAGATVKLRQIASAEPAPSRLPPSPQTVLPRR